MWKRLIQIFAPFLSCHREDEGGGQASTKRRAGLWFYLKAAAAVAAGGFCVGAGLYCYAWAPLLWDDVGGVSEGAGKQPVRMRRWRRTWTSGARDSAETLAAGYRLSRALLKSGKPDQALKLARSLRDCSAPGRPLWRQSVRILMAASRRTEKDALFLKSAYQLLANAGRYPKQTVSVPVLYRLCTARLNRWLRDSTSLNVKPPEFGRVDSSLAVLDSSEIEAPSPRLGDEPPEVQQSARGLTVQSDGASLSQVMKQLAAAGGQQVKCGQWSDIPVFASMRGCSARLAQRVIAGSVGARPENPSNADAAELQPARMSFVGTGELVGLALELQRLIILCDDEKMLSEAHYALARFYAGQGRLDAAVAQLGVLRREFPESEWAERANYLAGRLLASDGCPEEAASRLSHVSLPDADGKDYRLAALAWRGICHGRTGNHGRALRHLRQVLELDPPRRILPQVLFALALNSEKAPDTPVQEARERYREVRIRYPDSSQAARALFRLGRIAVEEGRPEKAVSLFRQCLTEPTEDAPSRDKILSRLLRALSKSDRPLQAAVVGRVLMGRAKVSGDSREAMLSACRRVGLHRWALSALEAAEEDSAESSPLLQRARFLAADRQTEAALKLLRRLGDEEDRWLAQQALVEKGRILFQDGQVKDALGLLKKLALDAQADDVCREALELMGRCYMALDSPEQALRAYSGKVPVREGEEGS